MIIKCPECGHQVSDKAPVCPSCGVEIAGKVIRCPHCGEIHFISDGICPNCHHSLRPTTHNTTDDNDNTAGNDSIEDTLTEEEKLAQEEQHLDNHEDEPADSKPVNDDEPVQAVPIYNDSDSGYSDTKPQETQQPMGGSKKPSTPGSQHNPQKKSHWPLIVSLIIAVGICLVLLFAYGNANRNNEEREYRTAIESRDPAILQSYLNTYTNAPTAHRDSVLALLNAIRASDPQWNRIKNSNDVNAIKAYLQQNPNSPHRQELLNRIDDLDWQTALQTHDFANYLSLHQNGKHATEAVDSVKLTMDMPADGADKQKAVSAVRSFLVALNSHNSDRVKNCVAEHMDYFNEKSSVDGDEALNYMAIIYKNADRLNWHVDNADAAKVTKIGNGSSVEYSITMPARLSVNYTSGNNVQARYNIQAKVNSSGLISAIKLIKQAEEAPKASSNSSKSETKKTDNESKKTETKKSSDTKKSTDKKTSKKSTTAKK